MSPRKRPNRRHRRFLVDQQQIRFAITVAMHALLFPALFVVVAVIPPFPKLLLRDPDRVHSLFVELIGFALYHWWVVLFSFCCVALVSLLFSHHIFGPMRHFEAVLKKKQSSPGEPVVCRIRKGDYFDKFSKLFETVLNTSNTEDPAELGPRPGLIDEVNTPGPGGETRRETAALGR